MMKKLFVFCSLLLLGVACSQDDSLTSVIDPVPEGGRNANPYVVTVEEALANLDQVLAQIDGDTRAGAVRRAVSVDKVKAADVCDLTRSEAALDVEDLLYVASFGEGNGSAVLGADRRVTQVMAVLDETVLTAEDFIKFDTRATSLEELTPEEDLRNMLTDMITATAEEEMNNSTNEVIGPLPLTTYETVYKYNKSGPHLSTKWSQEEPFNNSCPLKSNSTIYHQPAGCVPVGVGQLLAYYQHPSPNIIDDTLYSWTLINQLNYPADPDSCSEEAKETTANYLRKLGRMMYAEYYDDITLVYHSDRDAFLRYVGFSNARAVSWNTTTAENIIYNHSKPIGTRGREYGEDSGHFWVLDGWMNIIKEIWKVEKAITDIFPVRTFISSTLDSQLVHCNYGYAGSCDGYYTPCIFDLSNQQTGEYIDTTAGDIVGSMDYNFNYDIQMILLE